MLVEPRVTDEVTCFTCWMLASAFSMGRVIWFSISGAAAPLWVTLTTTTGKLTLG